MPEPSTPTTNADEVQETPPVATTQVDYAAETTYFLSQGVDLDPRDIHTCRANTDLMAANIRRGVASIDQDDIRERIRVELPTVNIARLLELIRLGEVVAFNARNVMPERKPEELVKKTERGRKVRRIFFNQIETFISTGHIKQEELDKMRKGKGTLDVANDLIDSVGLLQKYEPVLGGRLSVPPELLTEGQQLGRWLRETVQPSGSPKIDSAKKSESIEIRDRLWTLLQLRHRELRRIGAWLWPEEVDKRVPPLLARQRKRKSKEKEDGAEGGTTESGPVAG